ncbi:MAG TPA: hypothetical protein VGX23_32775 [Actinocrinis sp.]|nr:hypothetical protein [Actinocrinis sp.]
MTRPSSVSELAVGAVRAAASSTPSIFRSIPPRWTSRWLSSASRSDPGRKNAGVKGYSISSLAMYRCQGTFVARTIVQILATQVPWCRGRRARSIIGY